MQSFLDQEDDLWIEEAGQCTCVCDSVLFPCSRSCNAKMPDPLPHEAFSTPLPVSVRLVGCHVFAFGIEKLCTSNRPIFTKIPKYCFNTSSDTETIAVSILFRRLKKNLFFEPSRDWQYSNSHKLEAHSKSQHPVYNRGPRGTANAQRFCAKCRCLRVPSQVGKLPCGAPAFVWAHAQTDC